MRRTALAAPRAQRDASNPQPVRGQKVSSESAPFACMQRTEGLPEEIVPRRHFSARTRTFLSRSARHFAGYTPPGPSDRWDFPCCAWSPLRTCRRQYPAVRNRCRLRQSLGISVSQIPAFVRASHQANESVEGAEASPVAMERPIQAKANRTSPATHAPRLNVPEK